MFFYSILFYSFIFHIKNSESASMCLIELGQVGYRYDRQLCCVVNHGSVIVPLTGLPVEVLSDLLSEPYLLIY